MTIQQLDLEWRKIKYQTAHLTWWIWCNWDIFTDYVGWCPDIRIYITPDDIQ